MTNLGVSFGDHRNTSSSDEIQLRIDPVHGDLDEEIDGLHSRVRLLKGVRLHFPTSSFSEPGS
jgi:protein transporter SFT1